MQMGVEEGVCTYPPSLHVSCLHVALTCSCPPSPWTGELLVRGPNLFKEYWGRPEATQVGGE